MKRGWKIFGIICASIAGVGVILCCVALALGFRFNDIPTGHYRTILGRIVEWDDDDYDHDDDYNYDKSNEYVNNGSESKEFTDIQEIDIEVTSVELIIQPSDTEGILVETEGINSRLHLKVTQRGNELSVKTQRNRLVDQGGRIVLHIPKGSQYREVNISIGAGRTSASGFHANSLDVEVGAGDADISDFTANEFKAECGAGQLIVSGDVENNVDMECGLGNIEFTTSGEETDYNYKIESGLGNITIGGSSFSGIVNEKKIMNNASKMMDIECGVGNINVAFEG